MVVWAMLCTLFKISHLEATQPNIQCKARIERFKHSKVDSLRYILYGERLLIVEPPTAETYLFLDHTSGTLLVTPTLVFYGHSSHSLPIMERQNMCRALLSRNLALRRRLNRTSRGQMYLVNGTRDCLSISERRVL